MREEHRRSSRLPAIAWVKPTAVRASVYDNAPYYVNWYDQVELRWSLNGGPFDRVAMASSGGQVFRGQIHNWVIEKWDAPMYPDLTAHQTITN